MSARKVFVVGLVLALSALGVNYSLVSQEAPAKGPIEAFVAEMKAFPGFFNLYLKKDGTLYLEVTQEHFGKDFLVVVQMARGIGESFLLTGYPLDSDLLQFRLRNDKIELLTRNPYFRAAPGTPSREDGAVGLPRLGAKGFCDRRPRRCRRTVLD
jgi:hypothetical protein